MLGSAAGYHPIMTIGQGLCALPWWWRSCHPSRDHDDPSDGLVCRQDLHVGSSGNNDDRDGPEHVRVHADLAIPLETM